MADIENHLAELQERFGVNVDPTGDDTDPKTEKHKPLSKREKEIYDFIREKVDEYILKKSGQKQPYRADTITLSLKTDIEGILNEQSSSKNADRKLTIRILKNIPDATLNTWIQQTSNEKTLDYTLPTESLSKKSLPAKSTGWKNKVKDEVEEPKLVNLDK